MKIFNKIKLNIPKNNDLNKFALSNIRESRSKKKELTYLSGKKKIELIQNCKVVDVSSKIEINLFIKGLF